MRPALFEAWRGRYADSPRAISEHLALAPPSAAARPPDGDALKPALERFEREHIVAVLSACGGDKVQAAERLGIHLATLYRRLERFGEAPREP